MQIDLTLRGIANGCRHNTCGLLPCDLCATDGCPDCDYTAHTINPSTGAPYRL